ncbi:FecR domain-containing protein [Sphingomonadaceae bacterium OTU29LAMAA1]|nr:FecR domain-containing protein [Sphingomonadaceae bacterium OTU29LAMAA1]
MTARPSAAEIEQAAVRWVVRLDADASISESAEFERWLDSDSRCRGALLQAEAAWLALDGLSETDRAEPAAAQPDSDNFWRRRRTRRGILAAAVGTMAASLGGLFLSGRRNDEYETTVGEVRRVPLADRSTMAINTASKIGVNYTSARRYVSIDRGEAWFRVTRDPAKPFVVAAGSVRVEAVGTAFSVRRRDAGAEVMVTEGTVRVWVEGNEAKAVELTAGGAVFVSDTATIRREAVVAPTIERKLAWRSGRLDLEGETLAEAVTELNRYSAIPIVIRGPELAQKRLYGVFRLDDPGGFARTAAITLGVEAWMQDGIIVLAARNDDRPIAAAPH